MHRGIFVKRYMLKEPCARYSNLNSIIFFGKKKSHILKIIFVSFTRSEVWSIPCLGFNPEQFQGSEISLILSCSENGLSEFQRTSFANVFLNINTYTYIYIYACLYMLCTGTNLHRFLFTLVTDSSYEYL